MDNMQIQNNLIRSAHENDIEKFIFLGSSCIYPKHAKQPIKEEYLLTAPLEPTNEWYAIAKISGVKLVEALRKQYNRDYVSLMPTNLYGPNDNFDLKTSHVLPAMIRKFHEAKENNHSFLRFDYSGHGKSSGDFQKTHFSDWYNDAQFLIEYLTEGKQILIGSSMGGWIMLMLARRIPEKISSMIGLAPAPDFPKILIWDKLNFNQKRQ